MSEHPGSGRRALTLAALVMGSLVVGLLLTEVAHRVARHWICAGRPTNTLYEHKDGYGWGHRANAVGRMYACIGRKYEWQVDVRTNAQGLRGEDRPYAKPAGVRRVLLLGDSITEAVQVPEDETFAARLEAGLRSDGTAAEVLNAGVAAFGTDNELSFFRAEGVRYSPDLVLLVFNAANDVSENHPGLNRKIYGEHAENLVAKTTFRLDAKGRLVAVPPTPWTGQPAGWWTQIESRFYVLRAMRRMLTDRAAPPQTAPNLTLLDVMSRDPDPEWREAWAVTEALVRELRTAVERSGARFAVAIMPSREPLVPSWRLATQADPTIAERFDPALPVRRMTAFLEREGIPHLDLLPPLADAAESTGVSGFFAVDIHLDATGHARVARALEPFVAEQLGDGASR